MRELEKGQVVKIKLSSSLFQEESVSCVIKWFEKDRVGLVFPDGKESIARALPEGKEIEAILYSDAGVFVFDSVIINSPMEHDFVIELPGERKKIQRRDYVRAPLNLNFEIFKESISYETRTINIGGGGIRFTAEEEIEAGSLWNFVVDLPDCSVVKGTGKILYTVKQGTKHVAVIVFTDIQETSRNKIIKLCFEQEVKNLKLKRLSN